jgi:hypothetical protein
MCAAADLREFIAIVCERTTPASLAAIERVKAKSESADVPLRVIWQTLPFAGGAVRNGIDVASGSHILMMSADLETDPSIAPVFIAMAKRFPNDMITASRWRSKGAFVGYNPVKLVCNWIFQKAFSLFYWTSLTDMTFGYRCAPARLLQSIAWDELKHPFFIETLVKPLRLGVTVHEIETVWKARGEGESQNSFWATFKYFRPAWRTRFMDKTKILKEGIKWESQQNGGS